MKPVPVATNPAPGWSPIDCTPILRHMVKYLDGLDAVATALAHPGRRQAVTLLGGGPASSSRLAGVLGIGLPAMHKHLAVLTTAGLIESTKAGRVVTHRLRVEPLRRYAGWLAERSAFWNTQLDALADAFAAPAGEPSRAPDDPNGDA